MHANAEATEQPTPSPDTLETRLARRIEETGILPAGGHALAAVSGGLDSVVMLHLLRALPPHLAVRITVAHFDHRMRPGSDEDAEFVRSLCRTLGVPCVVGRAKKPPKGETAARDARYSFLQATADRVGAQRIVTAHHADDQAETVLFRLIRGGGVRGLAGIPERRGRIVRPLLRFRRADIEAWAAARSIAWREDPTNRDPAYAVRNRLRHDVLPTLERIRPGATDAILAVAREAAAAEIAWNEILGDLEAELAIRTPDGAFQLARDRILRYHPHVRARVIRRVLDRFGSSPGRAGTHAALDFMRRGVSGASIELGDGLRLERHFDRFVIRPTMGPSADDRPHVIREPRGGRGEATIGGRRVRVHWGLAEDDWPANAESFDPTALRFPLELRAWRYGDRIRVKAGTRKIKKLFGERRVPRPDRARTPLLVQDDGRVVWVVGLERAVGAEPVAGRPVFHISVTDAEFA